MGKCEERGVWVERRVWTARVFSGIERTEWMLYLSKSHNQGSQRRQQGEGRQGQTKESMKGEVGMGG